MHIVVPYVSVRMREREKEFLRFDIHYYREVLHGPRYSPLQEKKKKKKEELQ